MVWLVLRVPSGMPLGPEEEAFEFLPTDTGARVREVAAHALRPKPGLRVRILLGMQLLEDEHVLGDGGLQLAPGERHEALVVLDMEPAVCRMVDLFRGVVRSFVAEEAAQSSESPPAPAPWAEEDLSLGKEACTELERLGPRASPASQFFVDWLDHPNTEVRQLAAWAVGGLGAEAVPLLPRLAEALKGDGCADVREEAAQSFLSIAAAAPAEMLLALSEGAPRTGALASEDFWWVRVQALRAIGPGSARAGAAVEELARAIADGRQCIRAEAVRALGRVDRTELRSVIQGDLRDVAMWGRAAERLEGRLEEARRGAAPREARRAAGGAVPGGCADAEADANGRPFPLPAGFSATDLRAHLYDEDAATVQERAFVAAPPIQGEAAWRCLDEGCVASDRFAGEWQALVAKLRELKEASRGGPLPKAAVARRLARLRRHFSRGAQAMLFFERLPRIEGGDPMHMWLFPRRGYPPPEDFEAMVPPQKRPMSFCRAGPSCLRQFGGRRRCSIASSTSGRH